VGTIERKRSGNLAKSSTTAVDQSYRGQVPRKGKSRVDVRPKEIRPVLLYFGRRGVRYR